MPFSSDSLFLPSVGSLEEAYAACQRLTRGHYENFPVASLWLPRSLRPAVSAVYAFARCADDFADELGMDDATRLDPSRGLAPSAKGWIRPRPSPGFLGALGRFFPPFLPVDPFDKLITAFEMDVKNNRHKTFDDLLTYCRYSANPVGEIVLRLFGAWTEPAGALVRRDLHGASIGQFLARRDSGRLKNRIYVPQAEMPPVVSRSSLCSWPLFGRL
jgi:phytoene/squalene synthetase